MNVSQANLPVMPMTGSAGCQSPQMASMEPAARASAEDFAYASFLLAAGTRTQVIPTPLHVLGRISPIFSPFFPVFCAFSPSRRGGSNEPQAVTQGQETADKTPRAPFDPVPQRLWHESPGAR